MRRRMFSLVGAAGIAIVMATTAGSAGQSKAFPRTPDGKPDLTGVYDLATLTPVERPANLPAILTDEEAAKLEKQAADRRDTLACKARLEKARVGLATEDRR